MNKPRTSLRCRLGLHPWDKDMSDEGGRQRCPRCGRFYSRSLYYGTWALIVSVIFLLFATVSRCSGSVFVESNTTINLGDRSEELFVCVVKDTTTGARVLITRVRFYQGVAAVLLPPSGPRVVQVSTAPSDEVLEHCQSWGSAETIERLAKLGWHVSGMVSDEEVAGLRHYKFSRPKVAPGMAEAPPVKVKP